METKLPKPSKSQCLRAGVELPPKREDVWPEFERLCSFYVEPYDADAMFVPSRNFLRRPALWRIDVLDELVDSIAITREHALLEWFFELQPRAPHAPLELRIQAFKKVCRNLGIDTPQNLDAMLVLSQTVPKRSRSR